MKDNKIRQNIDRAIKILTALGMPKAQLNERTGLCLLALLNIKRKDKFSTAQSNLIGITPVMDFCKVNYHTDYAPNTRETFRRFSMHQMVQAGIVLVNPDDPNRPTNSPKTVYQIAPESLDLIKLAFTKEWKQALKDYKSIHPGLASKYSKAREMELIPIEMGKIKFKLSPGEHNILIKAIIEDFGSRFLHGAVLAYVGDTSDKSAYCDTKLITKLGIPYNQHGKLPDVILFMPKENWIVIVESVTSHGPVDSKRHTELMLLFEDVCAEVVYVTAFLSRSTFSRYASVIAWETEVWIHENPDHLIHFNGKKFLGPYSS